MRVRVVALLLCVAGCYKTQGPAPPPPIELPPEVAEAFPTDGKGRPILGRARAAGDENLSIALVYDARLDDPITRYGACVERIVACKEANRGHAIADCLPLIPRCTDPAGGAGCCPAACLDTLVQALGTGLSEVEAMKQTVFKGDCIQGLNEFLTQSTVQP